MAKKPRTAITPTRAEDYPQWYQAVVKGADMAEMSGVRGCMVIKPWGFGIWELIKGALDDMIRETGHENCYFPLFIPLSYIEKEAKHVEGFAKEMAVVTHHRLEAKADGSGLKPTGELEMPLVVRPTSETIIGASFKKWIQSHRDLPLLINQWANVVRWEMRPRVFLRTSEFLWQEGHTAHETETEAWDEVVKMLDVYETLLQDFMAVPVIKGEKPAHERFPGANSTLAIEAMMQDGKALQAGTSHDLGQNFAKAEGIQFADRDNNLEFAWTTSWGVSTRLIGMLIMVHSDDDGLRLPPRIAPRQVVIIPINRDNDPAVFEACDKIAAALKAQQCHGAPVRAFVDKREHKPTDKRWDCVRKGVPIIMEIGPRDIENGEVTFFRRDKETGTRESMSTDAFTAGAGAMLEEMQASYLSQAQTFLNENIVTDITTFEQLQDWFSEKNEKAREGKGGFVRAPWSEDPDSVNMLNEMNLTIRCMPLNQAPIEGTCILTGKPATKEAIFAKSY